MILRLTLRTAELLGETQAEWQLLEKQARAGQRTTGAREEATRLRLLAVTLGVSLREEGVVLWKRRRPRKQSPMPHSE